MHLARRPLATLAATFAVAAGMFATPAQADAPIFTETALPPVGGTYIPVVGDFSNVEYYDDILWYAPGSGVEHLWTNVGGKAFTSKNLGNKVNGTYTPLVGDFTGDELDDILWYGPGSKPDVLWRTSGAGTFTNVAVNISGTYKPVVLDDEEDKDDILWMLPGGGTGSVWSFTGTGAQRQIHPAATAKGQVPLTGDFDDDGSADVFLYGPGGTADSLWHGDGSGIFAKQAQTVNGTYKPLVNEMDLLLHPGTVFGDAGGDDIFWYRTGAPSSIWHGTEERSWGKETTVTFTSSGTPLGANIGAMWVWSPTQPDQFWVEGGLMPTGNTELGAGYTPIVGNFYGGDDEVVFYKPGPAPEVMFA